LQRRCILQLTQVLANLLADQNRHDQQGPFSLKSIVQNQS
jgi:hypothetical protein